MRNAYTVTGRKNWREEIPFTLKGIRARVILNWILKKWCAGFGTGVIGIKVRASVGLY
jgi:hypothetical protein